MKTSIIAFAAAVAASLLQAAEKPADRPRLDPLDPGTPAVTVREQVDDIGENAVTDFGMGILEGAEGIVLADSFIEEPPPNPQYPEPLEKNALYFGGTDCGRFIPETLVENDSVRTDVSVVTQNGLADNRYIAMLRGRMGQRLELPSEKVITEAFDALVEDVMSGKVKGIDILLAPDGSGVIYDATSEDEAMKLKEEHSSARSSGNRAVRGDSITVLGIKTVMMINERLSKWIFDKNSAGRAVYVEESFPIEWMHRFMKPHGLVMKLEAANADSRDFITAADVRENSEFWDWMSRRLLSDKEFASTRREHQRTAVEFGKHSLRSQGVDTFAKLRRTHACVYELRGDAAAYVEAMSQAFAIAPCGRSLSGYCRSLSNIKPAAPAGR